MATIRGKGAEGTVPVYLPEGLVTTEVGPNAKAPDKTTDDNLLPTPRLVLPELPKTSPPAQPSQPEPELTYTIESATSSCLDPCSACISAESIYEENPYSYYLQTDYLLWFIRDSKLPILAAGAAGNGQPLRSLFGGEVGNDDRSGLRVKAGMWLDPQQRWALEAQGFFLTERAIRFGTNSDLNPTLARPFLDAATEPRRTSAGSLLSQSPERAVFVALPGVSTGRLTVEAPTSLWGIEANAKGRIWGDASAHVDLLGGFRYLDLAEGLHIVDDRLVLGGGPPEFVGQNISIRDDFETRNRFYGGQVGAATGVRLGGWTLDLVGKLGIGSTRQIVEIRGSTAVGAASSAGGLLALNSNSGRFHRSRFAVVPELGVNIGYQVTDAMRVYAGYTLLYWSGVARPGQQIDTLLDSKRIPAAVRLNVPALAGTVSPARPMFQFNDTGFWAQGLNCGVELRF